MSWRPRTGTVAAGSSRHKLEGANGYNAGSGENGDMIDAGLLLATEATVADAPKDDDHAHGAPGSGMGEMGGMDMICKDGERSFRPVV